MIKFNAHRLAVMIKEAKENGYDFSDNTTGADIDITQYENTLVVICQGSNEVKDWMTNFDIHTVDYKGIRAHHGYVRTHQRIVDFVNDEILKAVNASHIIYTGHSAGGGIAQMLHVLHSSMKPSRCIVFASPKPFKDKIRHKFVELYTNPLDIVPYLPITNRAINDVIITKPGFYHGISGYIKRLVK